MIRHEQRVIFGDTDQMGVVYYANYLRYFEAARGTFMRVHAMSYADVEAAGMAWPVIEAHVKYHRPARYDDLLGVELVLSELRGASLRFSYTVRRDDQVLADGYTEHACIRRDGRAVRFPPALRETLQRALAV